MKTRCHEYGYKSKLTGGREVYLGIERGHETLQTGLPFAPAPPPPGTQTRNCTAPRREGLGTARKMPPSSPSALPSLSAGLYKNDNRDKKPLPGEPFIFVSFNLSLPAFGQLVRIARGATEPRAGLLRQSREEKPLPAKVVAGSRWAQRPNEPSARRGSAEETAGLTFSDSRNFLIRPRNKQEPRGIKARSSSPALAGARAKKRNVRVYK